MKAHSSQRRPTQANTGQCRPTKAHKDETGPKRCQTRRLGQRCVFSFLFFLCFIDNKSLQQPTKANEGQHRSMQAHSRAQGYHHQPPTITTTATSPPAAPPAPPSPGLETHLGPLFRHSIHHHHHHWGPRHVSSLQFLFIYFILFYTSQGPRRVLGPCLFYFYFILFFLLHRD